MYKYMKLLVNIVVAATISACATPTISDHTQLVNITLPPGDPNAGIHLSRISDGGLDYGRDVTCDTDGSCTLFGFTHKSFGETTDFLAVHLDSAGDITWARTYGGNNKDELFRAIKTKDQGHLLIGRSESLFFTTLPGKQLRRPFILKLDKDGHKEWAKTLDLTYADNKLIDATQDREGNYILVGTSYVNLKLPNQDTKEEQNWRWQGEKLNLDQDFRRDILVLKLSLDGRPLFMNRYIPDKNVAEGSTALTMPNGHILIAGQEDVTGEMKYVPILLEIDSSGNPVSAKSYISGKNEYPNFMLLQTGGGIVLAGTTRPIKDELPNMFSLWLNKDGAVQNAKLYSNPMGLQVMNAALGHDSKLVIAGRTAEPDKVKVGVAFTINDSGVIDRSFAMTNPKGVELDGIWPLAGGGYRLLGDTGGFGASYGNIITATWKADAKAELQISESNYAPLTKDCRIDFMTGDLKSVTDIPASHVEMIEIQVIKNQTPH
jgi:hypothetical protein